MFFFPSRGLFKLLHWFKKHAIERKYDGEIEGSKNKRHIEFHFRFLVARKLSGKKPLGEEATKEEKTKGI